MYVASPLNNERGGIRPLLIRADNSHHGPWKMAFFFRVRLDGPIFVVQFLGKHQFTKPLGPSLGVNRMWIKRND